jgi:hypothetical protein
MPEATPRADNSAGEGGVANAGTLGRSVILGHWRATSNGSPIHQEIVLPEYLAPGVYLEESPTAPSRSRVQARQRPDSSARGATGR